MRREGLGANFRMLDVKLNSSPRSEFSSPGTLLTPRDSLECPTPKTPWSAQFQLRVSLECPDPECPTAESPGVPNPNCKQKLKLI